MGSVCTIKVGRLDDLLKVAAEKENVTIDPGLNRGYIGTPRPLWAADTCGGGIRQGVSDLSRAQLPHPPALKGFRNHTHWSEFIGGDVVILPPYAWQLRYNANDIEVYSRIDRPVEPRIVEELSKKFVDFGAPRHSTACRSKNSIRSAPLAALCKQARQTFEKRHDGRDERNGGFD